MPSVEFETPVEFETRKRAVEDPNLRPRSYRDRQVTYMLILFGDGKTS